MTPIDGTASKINFLNILLNILCPITNKMNQQDAGRKQLQKQFPFPYTILAIFTSPNPMVQKLIGSRRSLQDYMLTVNQKLQYTHQLKKGNPKRTSRQVIQQAELSPGNKRGAHAVDHQKQTIIYMSAQFRNSTSFYSEKLIQPRLSYVLVSICRQDSSNMYHSSHGLFHGALKPSVSDSEFKVV